MALPKLNESPKYSITIPSTNKEVSFRPYLVKEEKVLMMALETEDQKSALMAIADTIEACVFEKIDTRKLTTFDVEYMFTQIRAKSAGETASIGIKCNSCSAINDVVIKLDDINVDVPVTENIINLTDEVSIELRWPSYFEITGFDTDKSPSAAAFEMAALCIEAIMHEGERTLATDCSNKELMEFIESMTTEQFKSVTDYIALMPQMQHRVDFDCSKCGEENHIDVKGLQNFF